MPKKRGVFLLVLAVLLLPALASAKKHRSSKAETAAPGGAAYAADSKSGGGVFSSAKKCGECHADIYENWRGSLHAASWQNPIFQAAYRKSYTESGGEAAKHCLKCHAPLAEIARDFTVSSGTSREGVTCDFCHSVRKVRWRGKGSGSFTVEPGDVKSSVLKDANPKKHKAAFSADFASSELCAGCHEFVNRNGTPVGTTYGEWKASRFAAEGKQCQSCHMAPIEGRTANEDGRQGIHDHSLAHSMEKMAGAIAVQTRGITRMQGSVMAEVLIANAGAGHAIPTGTPSRTLVLEVTALDAGGNAIETRKKVYRKRVLDPAGKELTTDGDAFWHGRKISTDNRLLPGETRAETFSFSVRQREIASVTAEAYLLYTPMVTTETEMKIPLGGASAKIE